MTVQKQVFQSENGYDKRTFLENTAKTTTATEERWGQRGLNMASSGLPKVVLSALWKNNAGVYMAGESFKVTIQFECQHSDEHVAIEMQKKRVEESINGDSEGTMKQSPIWAKLSGMDRSDYIHDSHHQEMPSNASAHGTPRSTMNIPSIETESCEASPSIITLKPSNGETGTARGGANRFPRLEFSESRQSNSTAVSPILPKAARINISRKLPGSPSTVHATF